MVNDGQRDPISIHALREEGDLLIMSMPIAMSAFLSTPSARRATLKAKSQKRKTMNFYPRPPRGGRPAQHGQNSSACRFLSTPSARRATQRFDFAHFEILISIHALREEGDIPPYRYQVLSADFYPRPPRGGRPAAPCRWHDPTDFYPRPPRGGRQNVLQSRYS